MHSFFFCELQIISFTFNSQFLYKLQHKVHLSQTVCGVGFSIFDCTSFLIKFMFLLNKKHGTLSFSNVITPFKIKITYHANMIFEFRLINIPIVVHFSISFIYCLIYSNHFFLHKYKSITHQYLFGLSKDILLFLFNFSFSCLSFRWLPSLA